MKTEGSGTYEVNGLKTVCVGGCDNGLATVKHLGSLAGPCQSQVRAVVLRSKLIKQMNGNHASLVPVLTHSCMFSDSCKV